VIRQTEPTSSAISSAPILSIATPPLRSARAGRLCESPRPA